MGLAAINVVGFSREILNQKSPIPVYIGRANARYGLAESPLHNPIKLNQKETREAQEERVLKGFHTYLEDQINSLPQGPIYQEINRLLHLILVEDEPINLICWCKPKYDKCHGDIIKVLLLTVIGSYFSPKSLPILVPENDFLLPNGNKDYIAIHKVVLLATGSKKIFYAPYIHDRKPQGLHGESLCFENFELEVAKVEEHREHVKAWGVRHKEMLLIGDAATKHRTEILAELADSGQSSPPSPPDLAGIDSWKYEPGKLIRESMKNTDEQLTAVIEINQKLWEEDNKENE